MKKYLVGMFGALAGVLALKVAHRRGFKDGVKTSLSFMKFMEEQNEKTEES